jgi:hypothetical protein
MCGFSGYIGKDYLGQKSINKTFYIMEKKALMLL